MLRGSIPPTGLPLPFISAGSTSLLIFMSAIGIVLNVDRQSHRSKFTSLTALTEGRNDKVIYVNKLLRRFHPSGLVTNVKFPCGVKVNFCLEFLPSHV